VGSGSGWEIWPFLVSMYQDFWGVTQVLVSTYQDFWGVTHLSLGHRPWMSREVCIDGEVPMVPDQLE